MAHSPESQAKSPTVGTALRWTAFFLVLALITAFCAGLFPIAPVVVATGSMEPAIGVGDVVLICRTSPDRLETGDVIQYQSENCTVIHRIVEEVDDAETPGFITRGDSNNAPDTNIVLPEQVLGRVLLTIPNAGKLTLWLHELMAGL